MCQEVDQGAKGDFVGNTDERGRELRLALAQKAKELGGEQGFVFGAVTKDETKLTGALKVLLGIARAEDLDPVEVALHAPAPGVRLKALEKVDDQEVLYEIVKTDPVARVRAVAWAKITDQETLYNVIMAGHMGQQGLCEDDVRRLIVEQYLVTVALGHQCFSIRSVAVSRLAELGFQSGLAKVAAGDEVKLAWIALGKIDDSEQLIWVFLNAIHHHVRSRAFVHDALSFQDRIQALIDLEVSAKHTAHHHGLILGLKVGQQRSEVENAWRRIAREARTKNIAREALRLYKDEGVSTEINREDLIQWRTEQDRLDQEAAND